MPRESPTPTPYSAEHDTLHGAYHPPYQSRRMARIQHIARHVEFRCDEAPIRQEHTMTTQAPIQTVYEQQDDYSEAPKERVRITTSRIRQLNAAASSAWKAQERALDIIDTLTAGRNADDSSVIANLLDARAEILEGDVHLASQRIFRLAAEFEALHA